MLSQEIKQLSQFLSSHIKSENLSNVYCLKVVNLVREG